MIRFLVLALCATGLVDTAAGAETADIANRSERYSTFEGPDVEVRGAAVRFLEDLDLLVFEQTVAGRFDRTHPAPRGQLQGAPVLGYVFPTTLAPEAVGFGGVEGIVALAVTLHPDFDDTPLWDENGDRVYDNDGAAYHPHWVVLGKDERVAGGLSVIAADPEAGAVLPPTNPGMPMFMDSPGFSVVLDGNRLRVLVPASRVGGQTTFSFDAVVAYMQVDTSGKGPMLGVYEVYSVLSGDLSLPYSVEGGSR